ncbi:MlaD family protein [Nocardia sp. NPDC004654]|uniref:MlaD family protein n=1 Tax=Nocardia sp. NPDC004654 TaxID=3154776 RepID=UPI00339DCCD4
MPPYTLPGAEVGPRRARMIGTCAVMIILLGSLTWRFAPKPESSDTIRVALLTAQIGAGVEPGTDVRLDGVKVGSVAEITSAGAGRERIELSLDRSQLLGLTDSLTVDFAPGNLFGITTVGLLPNSGGTELEDGSVIDLGDRDSGRVRDATLSALLRSTGLLTEDVLTPRLAELLSRISRDLSAFTPLLETIGATVRAYTETRQLPPSFLAGQFGSALAGAPPMLTGSLDVLESAYENEYMRPPDNLERTRKFWDAMQYDLLPVVTQTLTTSGQYFSDMLPIATMVLDLVSSSVSAPERSARQLDELLDRIAGAFHPTPSGPVLRVGIELDAVPGLATPLLSTLGAQSPGGER